MFSVLFALALSLQSAVGDSAPFAGFRLVQGSWPCKQSCLLVHRDSDSLRVVLEGKSIRMAYRNPDPTPMPYPYGYARVGRLEKAEIVQTFRAFFASELSVAFHAFVYTTPGLFNWSDADFARAAQERMISAAALDSLFAGPKPSLFTLLRLEAKGAKQNFSVAFESDGNGTLYLEVKPQ
jgi:hypothetical protein